MTANQFYLGCTNNLLTTFHYASLIQHKNLSDFFFHGKQIRRNIFRNVQHDTTTIAVVV